MQVFVRMCIYIYKHVEYMRLLQTKHSVHRDAVNELSHVCWAGQQLISQSLLLAALSCRDHKVPEHI